MDNLNDNNNSWQRENPNQTATAIEIRLSNERLINQLIRFLTGIEEKQISKRVEGSKDKYITETVRVMVGERKCNDIGVQSILTLVSTCINPSTALGNYKTDEIYFLDTNIILKKIETIVMTNRIRWEIQQDDYPLIVGMLKDLFAKFATRLLDDGERKSLTPTIVSHETITNNDSQKQNSFMGIPLPRGNP